MRRKKEKLVKLISADQKSPFDKKRKKEKLVELISADQKSPFDMRREKEKLVEFTKVYGNIAVSLTSINGYPLQEKDSLSFHSSESISLVSHKVHVKLT